MSPQQAAELADAEMQAVAETDQAFHAEHGPETGWSESERHEYVEQVARVHRRFHGPALGGAA